MGCPKQQTDAYDSWRGDERGRGSFNDCKAREASFDRWCGSQGTRMRFVPNQEQSMLISSEKTHSDLGQVEKEKREYAALENLVASAPPLKKTPGCYAWIPSGCPNQEAYLGADAFAKWRGDEMGRESASACKARASALDHWCGSYDAQTTFVAKDPKQPGCYAWRPLGCPRQQTDAYDSWRGDERGRGSYGKCKAREAALDQWCGSQGTRMRFVSGQGQATLISPAAREQAEKGAREHAAVENLLASAPALPKTPGCYAWIPSGCPQQEVRLGADAFAKWRGDEKGKGSASACKARAAALGRWCGSSDAQMTFVAEAPKKPGCYAWMPFGCPRQQLDKFDTWAADRNGNESFTACKEREAELDHWCGTK